MNLEDDILHSDERWTNRLFKFRRNQKASHSQSDHAGELLLLDDDANKVPVNQTDRSVKRVELVFFYSVNLLNEQADLRPRVVADGAWEFTYIISDFFILRELMQVCDLRIACGSLSTHGV